MARSFIDGMLFTGDALYKRLRRTDFQKVSLGHSLKVSRLFFLTPMKLYLPRMTTSVSFSTVGEEKIQPKAEA